MASTVASAEDASSIEPASASTPEDAGPGGKGGEEGPARPAPKRKTTRAASASSKAPLAKKVSSDGKAADGKKSAGAGRAASSRTASSTAAETKAAPDDNDGKKHRRVNKHEIPVSVGAALVALGVVYGDLGTSPVYMTKAVVSGQGGLAGMSEEAVLGMLSLVIWTLTLITTVKYVLIAMKADNHGEGGIFSLYSMVRRYFKFLAIPAMLGGAAFLADSILTPAVAITSAVEGLRTIPVLGENVFSVQTTLVIISLVIIGVLFLFQQAGTTSIGRLFGPVMTAWFAFIAIAGVVNLVSDFSVLRAFNPVYGIRFILSPENKAGLAILGSVFLTITGAEALYSDMGHVGRGNIYVTWPIVKIALILNYLGQGAWLIANQGNSDLYGAPDLNPFFQMLVPELRPVAVVFGVVAGVIASQALITGAFTLVSEAARLSWMPRMRIFYPSETKGQLYIPFVNVVLWLGTSAVILFFQTSHNMEAAYGLALTVTMLSTTSLLFVYLWKIQHKLLPGIVFALFFGVVEAAFFASSLTKFFHGGYVTVLMALGLLVVMLSWEAGTRIERSQRQRMEIEKLIPSFERLSADSSVPLMAENLIYLTSDNEMGRVDRDIVYSVFANRPHRAHAYWIVNIVVANEPYTREYSVDSFGTHCLFRVRIRLGYKVNQHLRAFMRQIMSDMVQTGDLPPQLSPYPDFDARDVGDCRYVVLHKVLTPESAVPPRARLAIKIKYTIRKWVGSQIQWYGLESTGPIVEVMPLFVKQANMAPLSRVRLRGQVLSKQAEEYLAKCRDSSYARELQRTRDRELQWPRMGKAAAFVVNEEAEKGAVSERAAGAKTSSAVKRAAAEKTAATARGAGSEKSVDATKSAGASKSVSKSKGKPAK